MKISETQKEEDQIKTLVNEISREVHDELTLTVPELKYVDTDHTVGKGDSIWKEELVSFERFVNDSYHMNQPRLSYRQNKAMEEFLGVDPYRILVDPETTYRIAVLLWGKGAGKDWLCSLLQAYIVYLLLCMVDPRTVLGLAAEEAIDILNVAYSASQANEVYFTKFLSRVYNWAWLADRYLILDRGRTLNAEQHPDTKPSRAKRNYVRIGQSFVEFPGMIRAISEHSQSESYEGYNILFWVMDEAAAFRDRGKKANANDVFSTLRTSAHSRFPKVNRGILISYPRAEDDFMMVSYHKAVQEMQQQNPIMYADKGSTWEINPTKFKEDFASEFRLEKRESEKKYCCNPPATEGAVLLPEAVDLLLVEREPLFTVSTSKIKQSLIDPIANKTITKEFIGKVITHINISTLTEKSIPRVFHVDAGLTICPAAMVIAHGRPMLVRLPNNVGAWEEQVINKVIVDQVVVWMPDKEKGLQVSINNIASIIQELANHCNISCGSYDNWNSQSSIEALTAKGIYTEKHDINSRDFSELEMLVNLQAIDIPYHDNVEWEILTQLGLKK